MTDTFQFGNRTLQVRDQLEDMLKPVNIAAQSLIAGQLAAMYGEFDSMGLTLEELVGTAKSFDYGYESFAHQLTALPNRMEVMIATASNLRFALKKSADDLPFGLEPDQSLVLPLYVLYFEYEVTRCSRLAIGQCLKGTAEVYYHVRLDHKHELGFPTDSVVVHPVRTANILWDDDSLKLLKVTNKKLVRSIKRARTIQAFAATHPFEAGLPGLGQHS